MSQSSYLYMQTQTKHASWGTKDSLIGQPIYCPGQRGWVKDNYTSRRPRDLKENMIRVKIGAVEIRSKNTIH